MNDEYDNHKSEVDSDTYMYHNVIYTTILNIVLYFINLFLSSKFVLLEMAE